MVWSNNQHTSHKKGPRSDGNNDRGIFLLCTISQIFTKVINNKLVVWSDENDILDDAQGAYRKGRSTVDHIFSLQAIIQKYIRKSGGRFYVAFVYFFAGIWFNIWFVIYGCMLTRNWDIWQIAEFGSNPKSSIVHLMTPWMTTLVISGC